MSTIKAFFKRPSVLAILLLAALVSMNVGQQNVSAAGTLPCDIYASAGTPCVAAHSTTRALFGGYSGNLYQVKRSSDGATTNIGTLSAGGYANAAAQDSFCSGTSCTITIIYDQSGRGNNLTIEGPGGNGGQDVGANAAALPITAGGQKVYGLFVSAGVGYRNNATSGVPTGGSPGGQYMVTAGGHVNSGCCFDYGNAETNSLDNGNGHMDAVYFGTLCWFSPCSGSGPWVMADMENGLFSGANGSDTNNKGNNSAFVTALVKNNGQNTYAIKGGNANSGGLTTWYSGPEPHLGGYSPMHLEGAIVLGTGGDNSNASVGSFFEGVMTSGYPTDAADNSVQANIVSVGYSGGTRKIVGQQSSKCVDVQQPNTQPGANVDLWTCNGFAWQNWTFNDLHNGYFTVVSQNSGLCLDVTSASKSAGANVEQWTCNGQANQNWSWTANGSFHKMVNQNSGMCLDVVGQGTTDGTNIDQWTCNGQANQNWSQH
ncbi:MAG: arabinofuranosidase catalytic domain-containing protein [Aggregatilineales bacterium]